MPNTEKAYAALNALSLLLNEWEMEVRKLEATVSGQRADTDEAFKIVRGHLDDSMIDVKWTMDRIKEDEADAERQAMLERIGKRPYRDLYEWPAA